MTSLATVYTRPPARHGRGRSGLFTILDEPAEPADPAERPSASPKDGGRGVAPERGVRLRRRPCPSLHGLDLDLLPGSVTALVGPERLGQDDGGLAPLPLLRAPGGRIASRSTASRSASSGGSVPFGRTSASSPQEPILFQGTLRGERALRTARRDRRGRRARRAPRERGGVRGTPARKATRPRSGSAASPSPVASASASRSRARFSRIRGCSSSTRRRAPSTTGPRRSCARRWTA